MNSRPAASAVAAADDEDDEEEPVDELDGLGLAAEVEVELGGGANDVWCPLLAACGESLGGGGPLAPPLASANRL